jgi:probable addiction module antidote protein
MSRKIKIADLPEFDITEHLDSDQAIADYLTLVLEENDLSELAHALGVVARARGMTQVAQSAGLAREALYKALRLGAQPRFDTVQRVCTALGVKLTVSPVA